MSLPAGAVYVVERALSWLDLPPANIPDERDGVLAEWAKLIEAVTTAAGTLDAGHPIAVQLRAASDLVELDLARWRQVSRIDDVDHAKLERCMQRFAARINTIALGKPFDERKWDRLAWWEDAQRRATQWLRAADPAVVAPVVRAQCGVDKPAHDAATVFALTLYGLATPTSRDLDSVSETEIREVLLANPTPAALGAWWATAIIAAGHDPHVRGDIRPGTPGYDPVVAALCSACTWTDYSNGISGYGPSAAAFYQGPIIALAVLGRTSATTNS